MGGVFLHFITKIIALLSTVAVIISVSLAFYSGGVQNKYNPYSKTLTAQPYKGLMPFESETPVNDNYSMEWFYVSFSSLEPQKGVFDWSPIEKKLDEISSRGNQAAFRVYLNYPGHENEKDGSAVPDWVWDMGVEKMLYDDRLFADYDCIVPDYKDDRLIDVLCDFVKHFGEKYDGDIRIAYITAGLLGQWGEWHTYPFNDRMASEEQQNRIFAAYDEAFDKTPILARYPDSKTSGNYDLGFHDDAFTHETIGKSGVYFLTKLQKNKLDSVWKERPIGGEIYPQAQIPILNENKAKKGADYAQDYYKCVKKTHASWMMMWSAFDLEGVNDKEQAKKTADELSSSLGYDYTVSKSFVKHKKGRLQISFTVKNKGVAPLYYDMFPSVVISDKDGNIASETMLAYTLKGILPNKSRSFSTEINLPDGDGTYTVSLYSPNPMQGGKPIVFSNRNKTDGKYCIIAEFDTDKLK